MRRLAERGAKGADEVSLGDMRQLREVRYVERLSVGPVDGIASTKQAAVKLLDGPAHLVNKRKAGSPSQ